MITLAEMRSTGKNLYGGKGATSVSSVRIPRWRWAWRRKLSAPKHCWWLEKGRDALYAREHKHLYDHIIILDKFKDILKSDVQDELLSYNTVWIPHRSFTVYVGVDGIENEFKIPMYGNRKMLRTEDRNAEKSQYYFLEKAGIRFPKQFEKTGANRPAGAGESAAGGQATGKGLFLR